MAAERPVPAFDDVAPWGTYAPGRWHALLLRASHALPQSLRRLVFVLRRPIKYHVDHPLDVTIWGLKLRLLPRGNMAEIKLLFAPQLFDPPELATLAQHLRPGSVFIDIGANAGVYSFHASRCVGAQGRVLAVEPDPEMRRRLQFNLASNGIANVTLCPVALSDEEGVGELLVNPAQRGENTLARQQAEWAGGARVAEKVPLKTLLALLQEQGVGRLDALKIDIEGHEPPVLRHFFAHAPKSLWPALAVTEHHPRTAQEIEAIFTGAGYRRVLFTGLNFVFSRDPGARTP